MATKEPKRNEQLWKIAGAISPLFVSSVLLAVQWGSVTTTIEVFQTRMDEFASKVEKTNETLVTVQKDVAYIKGKLKDGNGN